MSVTHTLPRSDVPWCYVDGASSNKYGKASWGYVIYFPDGTKSELSGRVDGATNNEMELLSIYMVLVELRELGVRSAVVVSDSTYAIGTISKGWKRKANQALLAAIDRVVIHCPPGRGELTVVFHHVPGHAGHEGNEAAHELCQGQMAVVLTDVV